MLEQVMEKLEGCGMEDFAVLDGFYLRSIVFRVISDFGKFVVDMCELFLEIKDVQVVGFGLNIIFVFVIMFVVLFCFLLVFFDKFCRYIIVVFRGDVKFILEREILEFCDKVNV